MTWRFVRIFVGSLFLGALASCVNAYRAPPTTTIMSDCEDYEKYVARKLSGKKAKSIVDKYDVAKFGDDQNLILEFERDNERAASAREHSGLDANPIIVRYSEGGDLVSRCDYNRALESMQNLPRDGKTMFVYVHGWRNDSGDGQNYFYNYGEYPSKTDGNDLARFKLFLRSYRIKECEDLYGVGFDDCADPEKYDELDKKSEIIGIFVSWRGGTAFEYLDYWSRRGGADKLSRSGQIPRLFGALENISRDQEYISRQPESSYPAIDNKLIYIGHSMGARILYNSVAPVLIAATQDAHPMRGKLTNDEIVAPFDLAILINPALEAASYKSIDEFRYTSDPYHEMQLPLLVTIQSEGDLATKSAFAFAEGIGWLVDPWQSAQRRRTIGHSAKFFQTHYLQTVDNCVGRYSDEQTTALDASFCASGLELKHCPAPVYSETRENYPPDCPPIDDLSDGPPPARDHKKSPFLVVRAQKAALNGHGWMGSEDDRFLKWFVEYVDRFNRRSELRTLSRGEN